jgi:hypothetical protein
VASLRGELARIVEGTDFPLTKAELLAMIESRQGSPDLVEVLQPLADEHFADEAELFERFDEALGMPAATPGQSVLEEDKGER